MSQELSFLEQASATMEGRRWLRYQPLVVAGLAVIVGIAIDHYFAISLIGYLIIFSAGCFVWLGVIVGLRISQRTRRSMQSVPSLNSNRLLFCGLQISSTALLVVVATVAAIWHHGHWNWFGADEVGLLVRGHNDGLPVCVEGRLASEPRWITPKDSDDGFNYRRGEIRTRVELKLNRIQDRGDWRRVSGSIDLMILGRWQAGQAGDDVRVFGILIGHQAPGNPGQFDFQQHHRAKRKLATLHVHQSASVVVMERSGWRLAKLRSQLRTRLDQLAWDYLTPDQAAFASAIMLGNREQLSPERRERFLRTGTAHLLAISGLHVGILASSFFFLLRLGWLNRRQCLWVTILFVLAYAWLVEFRPPVVRATVLIVVFSLGRMFGQRGFGFNLLALAAIIVLIFNPHDLFNLGAQLSFLAVGTLIFAQSWIFAPPSTDPLQRLIANTRPWPLKLLFRTGRIIRSAFLASAFIWLVAMPMVAYHFHVVAPVGMVINPLLLIPLAIALYSGLIVMALGEWFPPLAGLAGKVCQTSLGWVERLIESAELWPYGYCITCGPSWQVLSVFYAGLFGLVVFKPNGLRLRPVMILMGLWLIIGWWGSDRFLQLTQSWRTPQLVCTIIDVGHGNSVLLEMPDGQRILYDAGSFGSASYGYDNISAVLWFKRIDRLDRVVISHADLDHYNALAELSQRFTIGELVITSKTATSTSSALGNLINRLTAMEVPIRIVAADRNSPVDQLDANRSDQSRTGKPIHELITILSPPSAGTDGNDNSDSLVLAIDYQDFRVLLTGDIEGPGLTLLLEKPIQPFDLVMAPHHGSFNSDPSAFMEWCQPRIVAISGAGKRIRENAVEVFERNQRLVVRTDRRGAIEYSISRGRATLKTWCGNQWQALDTIGDQGR